MKKYTHCLYICLLILAMVSCQSEDDLPVQHADGYGQIQFAVGAAQASSRAGEVPDGYESYDTEAHPQTMGVFGYHSGALGNNMFSNTDVTYNSSERKWSYDDPKYWVDYTYFNSFDFFAYMPYVEGASLEQGTGSNSNKYTLNIPVSLKNSEGEASPILFDRTKATVIATKPVHETLTGNTIAFQFDQTLTGFNLKFKLGTKMNEIRQFVIKSVNLYGSSLANSGSVSRTYQWDATKLSWSSQPIAWTISNEKMDVASDSPISIPYVDNGGSTDDCYQTDENSSALNIKSDKLRQWGSDFYCIPDAAFNPTIEVTYDVVYVNKDGDKVVTRKDVVSTIVFNKTNFSTYTSAGRMGHVNSIEINIVPRYLYVLADDDQATGYIIIE